MINLVVKDLRLIKKITMFGLAYTFAITVVSLKAGSIIGNVMYCFLIICMTYISVLYADGYDETNKGYLILASLPLKRYLLVGSKYLSLGLYFIIYTIAPMVMLMAGSLTAGRELKLYSPYAILGAFVILGVIYSIYYPLYYKFGYNALKIYKILIFLIIMISPKLIQYVSISPYIIGFNNYTGFFAVLIVMIMIFISCFISVGVYEKKELI